MAKNVIDNYVSEQLDKAINKIQRLKINGVRGIVAKADVVNVIKELKKQRF